MKVLTTFDYAVIGEGEVTFLELIEAIEQESDVSSVQGLAFREEGSLRVTPPRTLIPDLDALPFPAFESAPNLSLYNPPPSNYKKLPVASVITSRGCPNNCTFCGHSVFGRKMRQRSPENIAAEIETLYHRFHVREITFVDDTFTIRPKRIIELFHILGRKGIQFPWTCMSRINTVDYETLRFFRDKGCWHISFGIESGNEDILRRIKKNISLEDAKQVIGWCRHLGIRTKGFFIIGHPGETLETIDETIQTALDMPLDDVVATLNTPLPGTEQLRTAHLHGDLDQTDWTRFNMWTPVFIPTSLSQHILLEKHKEFYRRFYLRPRIIARYLVSFFSPAGLRRAMALFLSLPFFLKSRRAGSR